MVTGGVLFELVQQTGITKLDSDRKISESGSACAFSKSLGKVPAF